ncbi:hypothetical protein [Enterococcus sp.]|uniref:hypothetical protein n=1 Tax=Enterococcus sp. TaxID=35783 RepID=UPI00290CDD1C|nr:hypothetical protein [Enterococcus sp.]MDU5336683.1 hypothetical protein [Enterococcus sp.]
MTEDLIVTFGKGDGGTHDWKYKGLDPDLPVPKIKEACELLTKLDICTEKGVNLFDSIVTAKVVTTIDTLIFDPEHETKGLTYYGKPDQESTCEEVRCFEVADEPKKAEQKIFSAPIVPLREIPKQTALTATPGGPYSQQLTTIVTSPIKVAKESLPKPKRTISEQDESTQNSEALTNFEPVNQSKKEHNGLLRWIHRLRNRNKEDPLDTPRE